MTKRAASRSARVLPVLLILGAVAIAGGAACVAACGGEDGGSPEPTATVTVTAEPSASPTLSPSQSASPEETPAALTPATLYFMRDGALCAVERRLDAPTPEAVLKALLRGPTADEQAAGVTTAIPAGTRMRDFSSGDGEAIVDLSSAFARSGSGAEVRARMAQIVFTATGMEALGEDVTRVGLRVRGVPIDGLSSDDGDIEFFPTRTGYRNLEPAILVEHPGLGSLVSSPFELSGTASVFEGSFQARLVDNSGRRIVNVTVQASRGGPGRGRFRKKVAFSTSASAGTLIVYSLSMEDGSRQDLQPIPVTFAQE